MFGHLSLNHGKTAGGYIVGGDSGNLQHGAVRKISCGKGFTAGRGRSPAITKCNDGVWTRIKLECRSQCGQYNPPDPNAFITTGGDNNDTDHGAFRLVQCANGYFPTPALSDSVDVITECQDGAWSVLPMSCIKPETVDPSAGPGMFIRMMKQLFTGPGMIGIASAVAVAVAAVIAVAVAWRLHFKHQAKQNTIAHETRMDYVAKLAALTTQQNEKQSSTTAEESYTAGHASECTDFKSESDNRNEENSSGRQRQYDEDYFGDVELTPVSTAEWDERTRRHYGLSLMMSDADGMTGRTMRSISSQETDRQQQQQQQWSPSRRRGSSTLEFSQAQLLRAPNRRFSGDFTPQALDEPTLISMGDGGTSPIVRAAAGAMGAWQQQTSPIHGSNSNNSRSRRHSFYAPPEAMMQEIERVRHQRRQLRMWQRRYGQQYYDSNAAQTAEAAAAGAATSNVHCNREGYNSNRENYISREGYHSRENYYSREGYRGGQCNEMRPVQSDREDSDYGDSDVGSLSSLDSIGVLRQM